MIIHVLYEILHLLRKLEKQMEENTQALVDTQELINQLNEAVASNTNAQHSLETQFDGLVAHVNELLAQALAAPSLEETNALITASQNAIATLNANRDEMIAKALQGTPAETPAA